MAEEKDPADGALWKRGDGLCGALEHNVEDREGRIDVVRGQVAKGDPEAQGDIDALVGEIEADRDELAQHRAALDENGHAERAAALDAALERQLSAVADLLAGSFDEVGQDENDVQLDVDGSRAAAPANAPAIAARGAQGAGGPLPFRERIQASFGRHDVSGVRAHTDGAAQAASAALGARAYASGDHVAFGGAPDLHTAAHEAAHVVQQRAGVALKGGVGAEGDVYERHADAVADLVVRGEPAEGLLDRMAGPGAARAGEGVQLKREKREHTAEERAQMAQGRLHLEALRASQREVEKQLRKVERRAKKKGADLKAIDSELAALESWCAKDVAKFYGDELTRSGYLELKERTGEDARATIYGPSRERLERIRALRASLEAPMREQDFTARAETTEPEELEKKKQKGAELAADAEKLIAELTRSLDQVKQRVEAGDPRVDDEHRAGEISLRARSRIFLLEQLDLHVQQAVGTAALDGFVSRLTAISQEADALAPRAKRGDIPEGGHLERRSETWEDGKFKGSQEAWRTPSARGSSGRAPAPATKPGGERAQVEPAADDAETVERESAEEESKATA
ncbi:MAG: DUF4157 domain-containing protein [Deltaproteobacteria bacterium]|nr:DUF4157 domain-containing protein [Deltaproteobacteria bacterium]